ARHAPQWPVWIRYRNSLRGLYTIVDYEDDLARLRGLTVPALIVTGSETVGFHQRINEVLGRTLPRADPTHRIAALWHEPARSDDLRPRLTGSRRDYGACQLRSGTQRDQGGSGADLAWRVAADARLFILFAGEIKEFLKNG
ncbi:MAG: hypothetical protein ACREA0_29020, partial [bacterium]